MGIHPESGIFSSEEVTRVYRAEIPPLKETEELSKSDILLGAILRTCERNRHLEEKPQDQRIRSFSEKLEPLDLSFDAITKDWSEDDEEEEDLEIEVQNTSRRSSFSADGHVPTPDECASFRKSFDSAASMVFHR